MSKNTQKRGICAVGLFNPKDRDNMGGVMRASGCYSVQLVAIQGMRFSKSNLDTQKIWRHTPVINTTDLFDAVPFGAVPVAVEFIPSAISLVDYVHPESAFYIFGPEDGSISKEILARCRDVVYVPTALCMNLAATVNVVLYDRLAKSLKTA
jgi:tRNA(Leu) C34 or U34 (ribose-2'-O)-methylase TrmL